MIIIKKENIKQLRLDDKPPYVHLHDFDHFVKDGKEIIKCKCGLITRIIPVNKYTKIRK